MVNSDDAEPEQGQGIRSLFLSNLGDRKPAESPQTSAGLVFIVLTVIGVLQLLIGRAGVALSLGVTAFALAELGHWLFRDGWAPLHERPLKRPAFLFICKMLALVLIGRYGETIRAAKIAKERLTSNGVVTATRS